MFFLKKLISALLLPTTLALGAIVAGLVLVALGRRPRLARGLTIGGLAVLLLGSSHFVTDLLLTPLERYPPLFPRAQLDAAIARAGKTPRFIVVLGGGDVADARVPANDQLTDSGLSRLVEGIRLLRELPGSRLILSGGYGGAVKHADRLGAVAAMLGVRGDEMELDRSAWDTEQEAAMVAQRIGGEPFLLVTSAFHMPRSLGLFRKAGTQPIPAPTHHYTLDAPGMNVLELFPDPAALTELHAGVHEYLGMVWSKLRGRI